MSKILRRLAVALLVFATMEIGVVDKTFAGGTNPTTIIGGCRVPGDPYSFEGTGYLDVAKSYWDNIYFSFVPQNINSRGANLSPSQLHFTGTVSSAGYGFSYRTPDIKSLPLTHVSVKWYAQAGLSTFASGNFSLSAKSCDPESSNQPVSITNSYPVTVSIAFSGDFQDRLIGRFSVGGLTQRADGKYLVGIFGKVNVKDKAGNTDHAMWLLSRSPVNQPKRPNIYTAWAGQILVVGSITRDFQQSVVVVKTTTTLAGRIRAPITAKGKTTFIVLDWQIELG